MHCGPQTRAVQARVQQCTEQPDSDAFFDLLTGPRLLEGVGALAPERRNRLFPHMKVLSMFCNQVLSAGRSCQRAVDGEFKHAVQLWLVWQYYRDRLGTALDLAALLALMAQPRVRLRPRPHRAAGAETTTAQLPAADAAPGASPRRTFDSTGTRRRQSEQACGLGFSCATD